MTTTALYNYTDRLTMSILRYFSRSFEVSFDSQVYIIFIYNLLLIINSNKLVMPRENSKNFTYAFCKSGALHILLM
jgi:hypothetical protein